MEKKSQAEIWEKKLKSVNLYRILMVVFLTIAVIATALAVIFGVRFKNFKDNLEHPDWISIVIQTRQMPDSEIIPEEYQVNVENYGGSKVDGAWFGKTLEQFLISKPDVFSMSGGMLKGINKSEDDREMDNKWWIMYSPTDPNSSSNPDDMTPVGAPFIILQNANVFYLALFENNQN